MKPIDPTKLSRDDQAKQRELAAIEARLARHEKVTRVILMVVVFLAVLALIVVTIHLFHDSTQSNI